MNTHRHLPGWSIGLVLLTAALLVGCHEFVADKDNEQAKDQPATKKVKIGENVFLEIYGEKGESRRVLVNGAVCRQMGQLEQFMCKKMTKEHEAIVAADCDAKHIHAALVAAGAEPGSPVKFQPKYTPASGTTIKVYVQYELKGKKITLRAQEWVKDIKTKREMKHDWVFAGSFLIPNRFDPKAPPLYAANDGDVICLANFDSAMLDLPIESSKANDELEFEAFTERIPPLDTPVVVILEPVLPPKKK